MNAVLQAALRSWPLDPWLAAALLLSAGVYCRGWLILRQRDPRRWTLGRLAAFCGGVGAIYLALASPIETFASLLLSVHMTQHVLLMMVAPPLVWLGAPFFPMLRGLPQPIRAVWIGPLVRSRPIRRCCARLTEPAVALLLLTAANWFWHVPAIYDAALRNSGWHYLQHVCFLGAALAFWYPVVRPYPARPAWSEWLLLPLLLLADVQNTLLAALLTFASRPLYPFYLEMPRLAGIGALADQALAGVIMWISGSLAFLGPLCWVGVGLLYGDRPAQSSRHAPRAVAQPRGRASARLDLLYLPLLGRFLKWRHARLAMQLPLSLLAVAIIADGLFGPQVGAMNLAGVLPWIHWRGFLVLALLVLGNVFCMACPFMLPRTLARRLLPAGRAWPRWLRNKWLAVLLLGLFFWSYEAFSLWDSPRWTAWIAVGYFAVAFAVDGFFRGASFCKYVCPIGQFNFVQSLVSPFAVQVRSLDVCASCRTKDCIRGRDGIPGCELRLFQPRKVGNMDCTVCLDCVHACPHENVGILARLPGAELLHEGPRSGLGRFSKRPDLSALIVLLVFAAFANAAGMVGPVVAWRERLDHLLGQSSPLLATSLLYAVAIILAPTLAVGAAAGASRWWGRLAAGRVEVATRFAYALVPLGFGMWLAHYCLHLVTTCDAAIPAAVRFVHDLGITALGQPRWVAGCCRPLVEYPLRLEILFLDLGLLLSLYIAYRIALSQAVRWSRAMRAFAPWALLIVSLFAAGIWLVFQPMQMRGALGIM